MSKIVYCDWSDCKFNDGSNCINEKVDLQTTLSVKVTVSNAQKHYVGFNCLSYKPRSPR